MSSCLRLTSRLSSTRWVNFGSSRPAMRPPLSWMSLAISLKLCDMADKTLQHDRRMRKGIPPLFNLRFVLCFDGLVELAGVGWRVEVETPVGKSQTSGWRNVLRLTYRCLKMSSWS